MGPPPPPPLTVAPPGSASEATAERGHALGEPEREVRLRRGEVLFRRGEATRAVFVLRSGAVTLERSTAGGATVVVHRVTPGESFAEAALFSDVYHCDAIAAVASRVAVYPREAALAALAGDAGRATALVAVLARRLRQVRALLELRTLRSAEERVVGYLELVPSGERAPTFAAMAGELGLTREAFSRAVTRLAASGRVRRRGRRLVLPGP